MYKFSERLKELRLERGLSIQALSKLVDIGVASICRWENGKADIRGEQLCRLADFFGVSTDYILGRED